MPEENATPEGLTVAEAGMTDAQKQFINTNFRGAVEEEFGNHASTADYTDLNGLLKSHINQQKLIGADKMAKPTKKWGKAEWSDFNKQIGMPAEAKDYELQKFDNVADDDEAWYREYAHGTLNLSQTQAQNLWASLQGRSNDKSKAMQDLRKTTLDEGFSTLKEEWGADKYDAKLKNTNEALQKIDEDGRFRKWMKDTGLNQEPEMLRFAARVAESFTEDRVPAGGQPPANLTKEAAQAKLNKIFSEAQKEGNSHALLNKKDPSHADAVKEITRLSEIAGAGGGM